MTDEVLAGEIRSVEWLMDAIALLGTVEVVDCSKVREIPVMLR
jgi:hypothetical protein